MAGQLDDFESGLKKPTATQPQHGRTAQTPDKDFLDEIVEESSFRATLDGPYIGIGMHW